MKNLVNGVKPSKQEVADLKYTVSETSITFNDPRTNTVRTVHANHGSFEDIKLALTSGNFDTAIMLLETAESLAKIVHGDITVDGSGAVYLDGELYESDVSEAIRASVQSGSEPKALINFLEKVVQNPSTDARTRLFAFLSNIDLPLADDGDIYAYKVVRSDLLDKHSGTFSNHIGAVVSMPRDEVQENKHVTCSSGLHFCSRSYIKYFSSNSDCLIKLKINPIDVVSIPVDYNNAKGRCASYEVVELLEGRPTRKNITESYWENGGVLEHDNK